MKIKIILSILLGISSITAFSHSGGLDRQGCHHDRKNGGYHFH